MARSFRTTRGTLGDPKGSLVINNRKAERLLRAADKADKAVAGAVVTRLNQNKVGEFLVSAIAAELNPELGISIPIFPLTARQILEGMDGFVAVPDPVWKNRSAQCKVPHPGIVFLGVVNAKNSAVDEANRIIQSGWADDLGDDFERARAKVRAGQILIDYLHFLEGRNDQEFRLGFVYLAEDLITDLCFATAAESGVTLKGLRVRPSAQFTYDELVENLGGSIRVSAFEGAVEYFYRVPPPHTVISVVRSMMLVAEGKSSQLDEEIRKRFAWFADLFAGLSDDEKRLVVYSAGDVLDDLQAAVDLAKERAALAGGNGHADVAASDAVAEAEAVVEAV